MSTLLSPELIQSMINDARFCSEFKFLCNPPKTAKAKGCGGCGTVNTAQVDWNQDKRNILGMPDTSRNRLKELLGVPALIVYYRDASGRQQNTTN